MDMFAEEAERKGLLSPQRTQNSNDLYSKTNNKFFSPKRDGLKIKLESHLVAANPKSGSRNHRIASIDSSAAKTHRVKLTRNITKQVDTEMRGQPELLPNIDHRKNSV